MPLIDHKCWHVSSISNAIIARPRAVLRHLSRICQLLMQLSIEHLSCRTCFPCAHAPLPIASNAALSHQVLSFSTRLPSGMSAGWKAPNNPSRDPRFHSPVRMDCASVFYHASPSVSSLRKRELTVSKIMFLFSLRMSHKRMVYFDHNHPLSTNSFQISSPYLPLPLLFLVLPHWVHLVLPICAWVWSHPMEYRKPSRGHVPSKENLFSLPEAINSSDMSGASEAPSILGFLLLGFFFFFLLGLSQPWSHDDLLQATPAAVGSQEQLLCCVLTVFPLTQPF